MKWILSFFVAAVAFHSISIEDTRDFKKVLVSIHYDGHADDRVLVDRDKMESDELGEIVKKIVRTRVRGEKEKNFINSSPENDR